MLLEALLVGLGVLACSAAAALAAESPATASSATASAPPGVETFDTAEQAAAALIHEDNRYFTINFNKDGVLSSHFPPPDKDIVSATSQPLKAR